MNTRTWLGFECRRANERRACIAGTWSFRGMYVCMIRTRSARTSIEHRHIRLCMYVYVHTYIHTYIGALDLHVQALNIHISVYVCMYMYIHTYIHT